MSAHPFAPGAIERHRRPARLGWLTRLPGTADQRRALLRALGHVLGFLLVVAACAFAAGVIVGVTRP